MPLTTGQTSVFNVQVRFGLDNQQFISALQRTGQQMQMTGKAMTRNLTLPMLAFAAASIRAAFIFNKGMANVASLIPGNVERVNELKRAVQDLAVAMGKGTTDLTDGLYQVISAFGDTADTMAILETNARLAVAGLSTVTDAINLTSAVTKGYGDTSAEAMKKVADLGVLVVRLGQTTFPELANSIGKVTPTAAALDVKIEELMATFATLTGVTGDAARVSTQLVGILSAMLKATPDMATAIEKLGFVSTKAMIAELGFVGAMRALVETTNGTEEAIGKLFPNVEALPAVFALAGGQAEAFDRKMLEMYDSSGALTEAFSEQTGGVNEAGFAYDQAKIKMEVMIQRLGDQLLPALVTLMEALGPVIEKLTDWIAAFDELDPKQQRFILAIGAIVIAAGPVVVALGNITTAVATLATALGVARLAALGLWGALGLAVGGAGWAISREMARARGYAGGVADVGIAREPWEGRPSYISGFGVPGMEAPEPQTSREILDILSEGMNIALPDGGLLTLEGLAAAFEQGGQAGSQAVLDAALEQFGVVRQMDEGIDDLDNALRELQEEITAGGGGVSITDESIGKIALTQLELAKRARERAVLPVADPFANLLEALGIDKEGKPKPLEPWQLEAREKEKERLREIAEEQYDDWKKSIVLATEEKRAEIAAALAEPMKKLWSSFRGELIDGARILGRSIISGDISRALQKVFTSLGDIIAQHIEQRITAQIPGVGGGLLGALGGGLVGGAISWLGGLFGGGKNVGADVSTPIFAYITNWDEFYQFGTTLPESFIYSGRQGRYDVDPHGRALDAMRTEWEGGEHFDY